MTRRHRYTSTLSWTGSTGAGYDHYQREHRISTSADQSLLLSADPAFGGNAQFSNPEQLLLASASSCQLLSFLAVAARARLNVVSYRDEAVAVMDESVAPLRISRIDLRPEIELAVADGATVGRHRLLHLSEVAHRECFIAHSLSAEVVVSPHFHWLMSP